MEVRTMNLGEFIPVRMKEIMAERGMEPTDFIRIEDDMSEANMSKLTSSRFYDVLNGKNENPKVDFIQNFCDIAGVKYEYFFNRTRDDVEMSLSEDEIEIINLKRLLKKRYDRHIFKYLEMLLSIQNEE